MKPTLFIICLFVSVCSLAQVDCDSPDRFREFVFEENELEVFPIVYANLTSSQLWNDGDTTLNNVCFDPRDYLLSQPDGTWDMEMNVYRPKAEFDACGSRPVILFVHGGGYNYSASGMEAANVLDYAIDMTRRGYVVCTIQYRKGWDQRAALNAFGLGPLIPGCQNCACAEGNQNCTAYTFEEMNYQMLQDTRAAHRRIFNLSDSLGIDRTKLFYAGASTGAVGAVHAAYASDDMPSFEGEGGVTLADNHGGADAIGEPLESGELDLAGVSVIAGAIGEMDWIENSDEVPLNMIHTTLDEAVQYCSGNILEMIYLQLGNPNQWLNLNGPGRLYKYVRCNSQGTNSLTKIRVTTVQGLYHSFTSPLGSNDASDNCDDFNSAHKIYSVSAEFMADVIDGQTIENQHTFVAHAQLSGPCASGDSISYTPCSNYNPCNLTSIEEHFLNGRFNLYPNPVRRGDWITVEHFEDPNWNTYQLIDVLGRRIETQVSGSRILIPMQLSPAEYFVELVKGDEVVRIPLLVVD